MREDMMMILLGDDPIPWGKTDGGSFTYQLGRGRYEDLTLTRIRSDANLRWLYLHINDVGRRTKVVQEHLNGNGARTGSGLIYEGRIARVLPMSYDANGNGVGLDRVVIEPSSVRLLSA